MNNTLNTLGYSTKKEYYQNIIDILSSYTDKLINIDGSVSYTNIKTPYFLNNDNWSIEFFCDINQLKESYEKYKNSTNKGRHIFFRFHNLDINREMKYIVHSKLFSGKWALYSAFGSINNMIKRLSEFINGKYPFLNSILDLDIDKANIEWIDWLESKDVKTITNTVSKYSGLVYKAKTAFASFLNRIYEELFNLTYVREEWDKDIWDVRNLEKYGVRYNKSKTSYWLRFNSIKNNNIKKEVKRYFKQRLLEGNKFSWSTAVNYMNDGLDEFINFTTELEPQWNDLKDLQRRHIEKFIEWLNKYIESKPKFRNSRPEAHKNRVLTVIGKFLSDIQVKEYDIAPIKNVKTLMFLSDKPTIKRKAYDQIDYIPDYVLEQLFDNINKLHKEIVPLIWIMYKTGLRISDVLELKQDCLIRLNNSFWVEADIRKTYIEGHRIPIDDELANMLAVLIHNAKQNSNQDNNPENYIFVRYVGSRKTKPYSQSWVRNTLSAFARENNITDELGQSYHFKNHAFRHTYAIKLLNGGADIVTVQELLAHASPEMTMCYARLLDETKRKVFDNVVKQGVFSFDESAKLKEENSGEIPTDVLTMLWTNHKLNAIDTPYGTCLQRTNGKCQFAKQPPCLTCNSGSPCKDLCIGAFEGDICKYEILINSTKSIIENANIYNRKEMAKENKELLHLYEGIYTKIVEGSIIYSRLDRLKKQGDINV